jgi:hypothetical protein
MKMKIRQRWLLVSIDTLGDVWAEKFYTRSEAQAKEARHHDVPPAWETAIIDLADRFPELADSAERLAPKQEDQAK